MSPLLAKYYELPGWATVIVVMLIVIGAGIGLLKNRK
jgi:uncharacterized membrane protein